MSTIIECMHVAQPSRLTLWSVSRLTHTRAAQQRLTDPRSVWPLADTFNFSQQLVPCNCFLCDIQVLYGDSNNNFAFPIPSFVLRIEFMCWVCSIQVHATEGNSIHGNLSPVAISWPNYHEYRTHSHLVYEALFPARNQLTLQMNSLVHLLSMLWLVAWALWSTADWKAPLCDVIDVGAHESLRLALNGLIVDRIRCVRLTHHAVVGGLF